MSQRFNVADFLRRHANERPDAPALRFPTSHYTTSAPSWDTWSFQELDRASDDYARGFAAQGVMVGDRTLMLMKPSLDFYAVLFGLFKAGAVPVLLDPGMGMKNLLVCIERTRPRVVVAMSMVHAVRCLVRKPFASAEILITAGSRWFWGGVTLQQCKVTADQPFEIAQLAPDDDAAIIFTSGSTGVAKGVASKHGMFRAQVDALQEMLGFEAGQSDVQCFAAFAIFDICMGMTSIIPKMDLSKPATANPADIVAAIQTWEPDATFGSPIVWQNLSRHCVANQIKLPSLKTALTVGAPIPAYLHRRFQDILAPGAQIWTPYGATEGLPVSCIATHELLGETWERTRRGEGTCVGHPAPGADIRIIGITEDAIPSWTDHLQLPQGEIGEIVVSGPQMSPEYKDVPQATRMAKIQSERGVIHRMGDLGYLDASGRLWFCGRKAHRIQAASGLVPAVPVEGVFNEHPDVFRTALVGVGTRGSEVPVLCVEMEPGKRWSPQVEADLNALAADTQWASTVARILNHPAFPTDARHNSKIRREDLRSWVATQCPDLAGKEAK